MTEPLPMALPPRMRSRVARGLTAGAAVGLFELQVCCDCSAVQYPPREACHRCLSVRLAWKAQSGAGELISQTTLHHSQETFYRDRLPWRVGMVKLDCGPIVITHVHCGVRSAPRRVVVGARLDRSGEAVLVAFPAGEAGSTGENNMADDKQLREMTCDPKSRKVLITDGGGATGRPLVDALLAAGADTVWVGYTGTWEKTPAFAELSGLARVSLVPLDVTNSDSVRDLGERLGAEVDILINNAELRDIERAHAEMEVNYFGLLRLAQVFGPAMRGRGALAWVNMLSIYALASLPSDPTFSASKAAACSLAQALRAQMQAAGVRVLNIFPGPIAPNALAQAVVKGLRDGVEDVYPGDAAQEWFERWRESPKALERELAATAAAN